jgi:hypothetical protein
MFKLINLWILRYQLAKIFKQAELYSERGIEKGSDIFVSLRDQGVNLVSKFRIKYPDVDVYAEFPALHDLDALATLPEPVDNRPKIALAIGLFIFAGIGVGAFGAIVFWTYHALTVFAH